jgi:hypothetical protein
VHEEPEHEGGSDGQRCGEERAVVVGLQGRFGSAGSGSTSRRLRTTIAATTRAWKTNAARQLIAVAITPPISGPAAAPMPPIPLMRPNAFARDVRSSNASVVRMYTGGINSAVPTPSRIELPTMSTPRPGDSALSRAPIP